MDSFPSGSEVLAFLISPDAKMEDCSFLHSSTNFSVFILTCQIICMTVLHLFVTIFVLTFLFPCFDFTACNLHSRISGRLGLELIRPGEGLSGLTAVCTVSQGCVFPSVPGVHLQLLPLFAGYSVCVCTAAPAKIAVRSL